MGLCAGCALGSPESEGAFRALHQKVISGDCFGNLALLNYPHETINARVSDTSLQRETVWLICIFLVLSSHGTSLHNFYQ